MVTCLDALHEIFAARRGTANDRYARRSIVNSGVLQLRVLRFGLLHHRIGVPVAFPPRGHFALAGEKGCKCGLISVEEKYAFALADGRKHLTVTFRRSIRFGREMRRLLCVTAHPEFLALCSAHCCLTRFPKASNLVVPILLRLSRSKSMRRSDAAAH